MENEGVYNKEKGNERIFLRVEHNLISVMLQKDCLFLMYVEEKTRYRVAMYCMHIF